MLRHTPLCLRLVAIVALPLLLVSILDATAWYQRGAQGTPAYGINFSCKRTQYFGEDCATVFRAALGDLGVRSVRTSVYWSDVEGEPGVYDFHAIDELLEIAAEYDARVTVSIGMRAQRYPEFWFPTWLREGESDALSGLRYPEDDARVRAALLAYLRVAARHVGAQPAVEAIQVENEPFVPSYAYHTRWKIRPSFLADEIEAVRQADGGRHPIVVSHASWLSTDDTWRWILDHADVLAQSVYTKRQRGPWPWLYLFPYRLGPLTPNLPKQAATARSKGSELWIGELQAEPYEATSVDVRRLPTDAAPSFSRRWLAENARLAARSGATRVYIWGVEWWAYLRDNRGDPTLWEDGKELIGGRAGPVAPAGSRR